jgi:hypothetical protein
MLYAGRVSPSRTSGMTSGGPGGVDQPASRYLGYLGALLDPDAQARRSVGDRDDAAA